MIFGVGVDIILVNRIKAAWEKYSDKFINRILSKSEKNIFYSINSDIRKIEFLSGRFAAKEAISKALGISVFELGFNNIEVAKDFSGKPVISNFRKIGDMKIHISISHTKFNAIAYVVVEK